MTLVEFLRARLDDDERKAKRVRSRDGQKPLRVMSTRHGFESPFLVVDSTRVLAEVDAKRRIADQYERVLSQAEIQQVDQQLNGEAGGLSFAVHCLGLPYAGHADYDESWRP